MDNVFFIFQDGEDLSSSLFYGGLGIRTLGRLITDTKFRVSHLRPLGQPSNIYFQHQVSDIRRKKERTDEENNGIKFSDLS